MSASGGPPSPSDPTIPAASIHVDLDGAREIFDGHGWSYPHDDDPIFESGMENFLRLLAEQRIRATLFVVARSLRNPRHRALVESAVREGHEIASHSLTHRYLTRIDRQAKWQEIEESRRVLEAELGVEVRGFRAPGYRIDRESLAMLADAGYQYDSSVFPTRPYAAALQAPIESLRHPHRPPGAGELVEWPMPDYRPLPLPFNPSYALVLGQWLFRAGVRRFRRRGRPLTLLFHLVDLADPLPRGRLKGVASRVFTLSTRSAASKRSRCQAMLDDVRKGFRILTTCDAIAEWRGEGAVVAGTGIADHA